MSTKRGRPRKVIDAQMLERLAACGCTVFEMAAVLECNKKTLERRYFDAINNGRMKGRTSLRHKQFQLAMNGDKTMLVWLGKQLLGQSDRAEFPRALVVQLLDEVQKVMREHVTDPAVQQAIEDEWDKIESPGHVHPSPRGPARNTPRG